jgi:aspartyl-tRNA synthetase
VSERTDHLGDWTRSDLGGDLRAADAGRAVTVMGWVHGRRDHGGVVFLDLRDRSGLVQVVLDPERGAAAHERGAGVRLEYVVAVGRQGVAAAPHHVKPPFPTVGI